MSPDCESMETGDKKEKFTGRITLNVSGAVFEVRESVLQRFPQTLLGSHYKRTQYYDHSRDQYFFDRHRQAFEAILFFYQSGGRLQCPDNVPDKVFADEINFFQIPQNENYANSGNITEMVENFVMSNQIPSRLVIPWQRTLWELFEIPESTRLARVLAIFSQFIIYLSVAGTCLETVKSLSFNDISRNEMFSNGKLLLKNAWFSFDTACFGWFTFECVVRFLAFPSKVEYFGTLANCVDLGTVVMFYIFLIVKLTAPTADVSLRILRFLTTIRIFKLIRYSNKMKIFLLTIASGFRELGMLLMFTMTMLVISSTAVFYAEYDEINTQFSSIPDAFWWAIITITTIGYGDKVPISPSGKFVGSICAVFGALTIALPLFRFAAHFRIRLEQLANKTAKSGLKSPGENNLMSRFE